MACIVSLLDDEHSALVAELWAQLERDFGLRGAAVTPYPHVTYHAAETYNREALGGALEDLSAASAPFEVETTGIGIFTGHRPVLYVAVIRGPTLTSLHGRLWQILGPVADGVEPFLDPQLWVPHITLGLDDVDDEALAKVMRVLAHREFRWHIPIDNLVIMDEVEGMNRPLRRFSLTGHRSPAHP